LRFFEQFYRKAFATQHNRERRACNAPAHDKNISHGYSSRMGGHKILVRPMHRIVSGVSNGCHKNAFDGAKLYIDKKLCRQVIR
jgi:hypothetical protein